METFNLVQDYSLSIGCDFVDLLSCKMNKEYVSQ